MPCYRIVFKSVLELQEQKKKRTKHRTLTNNGSNWFNNQRSLSEVELRKCLYEFHDIDNLSSQKLVSFVEATSIRAYSRETNKLRNINTIGSGARNISIKNWEINYSKLKSSRLS